MTSVVFKNLDDLNYSIGDNTGMIPIIYNDGGGADCIVNFDKSKLLPNSKILVELLNETGATVSQRGNSIFPLTLNPTSEASAHFRLSGKVENGFCNAFYMLKVTVELDSGVNDVILSSPFGCGIRKPINSADSTSLTAIKITSFTTFDDYFTRGTIQCLFHITEYKKKVRGSERIVTVTQFVFKENDTPNGYIFYKFLHKTLAQINLEIDVPVGCFTTRGFRKYDVCSLISPNLLSQYPDLLNRMRDDKNERELSEQKAKDAGLSIKLLSQWDDLRLLGEVLEMRYKYDKADRSGEFLAMDTIGKIISKKSKKCGVTMTTDETRIQFRKLYDKLLVDIGLYDNVLVQNHMRTGDVTILETRRLCARSKSEIVNIANDVEYSKNIYSRTPQIQQPTIVQSSASPNSRVNDNSFAVTDSPIRDIVCLKLDHTSSEKQYFSGTFGKDSHVFIKLAISPKQLDSIVREAAILKELKSSGVIVYMPELLDHCTETWRSYLVLDLFGKNLTEIFNNQCERPMKILIFEKLIMAVKSVHSCGIVHLDIKPQNVLVDIKFNGFITVKLCDFDSAQHVGETMLSENGCVKFTKQWVSPEVYLHRHDTIECKFSIDIFGLGLIGAALFDECVSHTFTILPWENTNSSTSLEFISFFDAHLTDERVLFAKIQCHSLLRYRPIVQDMCRLDPERRPPIDTVQAQCRTQSATGLEAEIKQVHDNTEKTTQRIIATQVDIHTKLTTISDKQDTILKSQEIIGSKLDSMLEQFVEFGSKMADVVQGNSDLQDLLNVMLLGSYDCPTLFVFLPVMSTTWMDILNPMQFVTDTYCLFFLCEHTMQLAPCGANGSKQGFQITCTKEWVIKAAPLIKLGLIILKEVLSTYAMPLPIAPLLNITENDVQIHSKYIDHMFDFVSGKIPKFCDLSSSINFSVTDRIEQMKNLDGSPVATVAAYEHLKSILASNNLWDNIKSTCGLRMVTHRNRVGWVLNNDITEAEFRLEIDRIRTNAPQLPILIPVVKCWSCCQSLDEHSIGCTRANHGGTFTPGRIYGGKWTCCGRLKVKSKGCVMKHTGSYV